MEGRARSSDASPLAAGASNPDATPKVPRPLERIGYVLKVFPRVSETFVINEIRALEALGADLTTFSLHAAESVPHLILGDLRRAVERVDAFPAPEEEYVRRTSAALKKRLGLEPEERAAFLPRKYVSLACILADLVRGAGIVHLHAHFASRAGHVAALAAALVPCTYSITAHAKDLYHSEVDRAVLRWKLCNARFVVTVNDYNRRYIDDLLGSGPAPPGGVVRLYNGVDLQRFQAAPYAEARPGRIVAVGRLVEKKGFAVLVDACRILKDRGRPFECEIIGGGPEEGALRERIAAEDLGDAVALAGTLATEEVERRLRAAALVALPCVVGSDGNVDALPTALLEAQATARPVVSTRISGIPEIVADGVTGLLVEPGDARALADALEVLLAEPGRAEELGLAARSRAERLFDLSVNAAELHRLFGGVVGVREAR